MDKYIEIIPFYSDDSDIKEIGELYCITFLGRDYSLEDKEDAIKNIHKHSAYTGFKGFKAIDDRGSIVGFSYGYTSLPEQFYRRKIAKQLSEIEIETWLSDCFEFVELVVSPSNRRLGVAGKLHDVLLKKNKHKTTVLTTGIENKPAINLYRKKGWQMIKKDVPVIADDNLQIIMGKEMI
ncbi:GNAT family N-acetyltransferase [Oceanobacillus sp. FSL H7-0719]|uniref:GNAT family N-acetyltransferase n=1 Tax=Oceanobacillus sp. FSL H7-0719 TaxID=2954507 RepID=UPI00324A0C6C